MTTPQGQGHEDVAYGFRTTIEVIERFAEWTGRVIAWLIIPMTVAVTWEVVARHFFRAPTIWAFDVVYMLYGTHFMLGTAYTLMRIGHVRTDMLYSNWSIRRQNWIDAHRLPLLLLSGDDPALLLRLAGVLSRLPDRRDLGREPVAPDRLSRSRASSP